MKQPSFQERHKGFGHCLSEDGFSFRIVESAYMNAMGPPD